MRLRKLSIDTLFTLFKHSNKQVRRRKEEKSDQLENFENYTFIKISKVFFLHSDFRYHREFLLWPYLDSTSLIFPTVPRTPKTELG